MVFEDMTFGPYEKGELKAQRAFELYENGKMTQALSELETALEINPSNSSWHFNKGLTLDAINRFDDAINEYEISLQLSPNDLEILNSLAVDYTRTGQYDLAIATFEQIQQLDTKFEPCYCNRIITYTEMGQHDLAEQMFYLAQQINPDCALCYYNIGNSLFARGRYAEAIRCWLRTAELEPTHPEINYRIAQAYWSESDGDESRLRAREHFLAELRTNPGDIDVIFDFGLFLLEVGDIESAKEKFNRILEITPDSAAALFYLGEIAFDSADYEQAAELFNQALKKDNTLKGPRYRLAQCALVEWPKEKGKSSKQQVKKDGAKDYLLAELRVSSVDADVLVSMGSMFLAIGDLDYATHCLLRAVDIDSANADGYYYLGLVSAIKGAFEDAVEFFAHALDIRPEDVSALRDSAAIYLAMGRLADAAERIKKARSLAVDDSFAEFTLEPSEGLEDRSQLKAIESRVWLAQITEQIKDFLCRLRPRKA